MKRFTTILCSIAFAVLGVSIAVTESSKLSMPGNMTVVAQPTYPVLDVTKVQIQKDHSKDLQKQKDSITNAVKRDTVYIVKQAASKRGKARVRIKYRTLYKSKLYIAIPSDKESSVDSSENSYHLHEVDNLSDLK